jgi:phosphoserine phosphatase
MKTKVSEIKAVTIDVDGCLVSYDNIGSHFHSSWDALGKVYGLKERWDERIKQFYKNGTDDKKWAEANTADLAGRKIEDALKTLYPIPYCAGAREFAEASKGKFTRGLLTTAIDLVAKKAEEELGLDFCMCNTLHRNNGTFTGTLDYNVPTWLKHEKLDEICQRFNIEAKEICHIGDNDNDLSVAEHVGMFIAMNPKTEEVRKAADYVTYNFRAACLVLGLT